MKYIYIYINYYLHIFKHALYIIYNILYIYGIYTVCIYLPDWPGYAGGSIIQPPSGHVVRNASQGADRSGMGFSNLWTFQAFCRWFL